MSTLNVGTVNATTALNTAAINGGQLAGFRNKILNGNFNIWQRATSFTGLTTTYTRLADRFGWFQGASGTAVVDITQSTDVPTMSEAGVYAPYSLYVDVTTADASIAAGDLAGIQYLVEGYDSAPFGFGQTGASEITLSFWVKATKTGTYCVSFLNSAEDRSYAAEYTISSSATWEKKTITLTADTTGTWLYTNGRGCLVNFMLACGSTYQISNETWTGSQGYGTSSQVNALDSNSNDFRLALIQLEIGDTATPFEQRSIGTELSLCQRYYQKFNSLSGNNVGFGYGICYTTTNCFAYVKYAGPMRTAPTISQSNTGLNDGTVRATTALSSTSYGDNSLAVIISVASGLTAGRGAVFCGNSSSAYIDLEAEL